MTDLPRRTAYDLVLAVERDGAYANLLLPRLLGQRTLPGRDAALATEIGYGTLRWQGVLDEVIASAAQRPVGSLDAEVRAVLRIGTYQLLHLRMPAHAAVHATVELARVVAGPRPVGFVNAVLRRCSQSDWAGWVRRLAPADDLGRLAFSRGYPRWIAAALLDALDGDLSELDRALAEDRPTTHLLARPGRMTRNELVAQAGSGAAPGPWSPYAVRLDGGDPGALAAVRDGAAAVQDEGSQLMALALAHAPLPGEARRESRWLDMCAGPGGKAALLAGVAPASVSVLATDSSVHRTTLTKNAVAGTAAVAVVDGTRPGWRERSFDRVLVDAPCTGLGALRRRPEVRWRRTADDVAGLVRLQEALLDSALSAVRPGGLVAYVTCSPHPAETTDVVRSVLGRHPRVRQVDARPALPDLAEPGSGPHLQLWPHRHGTDAMYLALLQSGDG